MQKNNHLFKILTVQSLGKFYNQNLKFLNHNYGFLYHITRYQFSSSNSKNNNNNLNDNNPKNHNGQSSENNNKGINTNSNQSQQDKFNNNNTNNQTINLNLDNQSSKNNSSNVDNTTSSSVKKPLKYSEKYKMTEAEIAAILKKPQKKPVILHGTEVKEPVYTEAYEKSIKEKIGDARYNTLQHLNTQLEETSKQTNDILTIRPSDRPDVKYYKYDLPIPNIDPEITGLEDVFEREKQKYQTVNQRVWEVLKLDGDSAYEDYEKTLKNTFHFEQDMYGNEIDVQKQREFQIQQYGESVLPLAKINDKNYMQLLKDCFTLNINFPGVLENEDPNKFIRNLRPIEEFRHTPQIPITERQLKEHQKRLENYHRSGLYFEIKKETIFSYSIFIIALGIGFKLLQILMEKEEEIGIGYQRMKNQRYTLDKHSKDNKGAVIGV